MNKKLTFLLTISLLLSSCTLTNTVESKESDSSHYSTSETDIESESETELESESESESETNTDSSSSEGGIKSFTVYASNDFHGHVMEEGNSMGLGYYGTFMKNKGLLDNTITIDQGDSWQGSIYSNYNYGRVVNDVMCEAKMNARTIGNHDFDWGVSKLIETSHRKYNNYTIPTLGANIYNYDFEHKIEGNSYRSDIAQKAILAPLENGLTVGIVGVIGSEQISSISSQYVEDICFKDHIQTIKDIATDLRNLDHCDLVIASCHAGQEDLVGNSLANYVDLVLCGHTHKNEQRREGKLYYAQFGANGEKIGQITIDYDTDKKEVVSTSIKTLDADDVKKECDYTIDPDILNIISLSNDQCDKAASEVLANNVSGYFQKSGESVNVMCKAILDKTLENPSYSDVIFSYCNTARAYLPYGTWTYADLYESFPFDNEIYIIEVTGNEIQNEVMKYNNVCRAPGFDGKISLSQKYRIACIDYLAFHTNSSRYYDYFPENAGEYIGVLDNNYRIILRDWLKNNGYNTSKLMKASDYSSDLTEFSNQFTII